MINYNPIPVLFELGSLKVYSWGLMFAIAFLVAFFFILQEFKKKKIPSIHAYNLGLLALIGAMLGSRLFYVIENLSYYISKPLEIFAFWSGGMTSYGGLIFGIFFVWLYCRKNAEARFLEVLDISAPYIILAFAIARIGCFLNWDDFGNVSTLPWAIKVINDIPRHPTQLYLVLSNLIIFFILIKLKSKKSFKDKGTKFKKNGFKDVVFIHESDFLDKQGAIFFLFLLLYSVFRFFIDFLRFYENYLFGLATSQWISILIFVISIFCIANIDKMQES